MNTTTPPHRFTSGLDKIKKHQQKSHKDAVALYSPNWFACWTPEGQLEMTTLESLEYLEPRFPPSAIYAVIEQGKGTFENDAYKKYTKQSN